MARNQRCYDLAAHTMLSILLRHFSDLSTMSDLEQSDMLPIIFVVQTVHRYSCLKSKKTNIILSSACERVACCQDEMSSETAFSIFATIKSTQDQVLDTGCVLRKSKALVRA